MTQHHSPLLFICQVESSAFVVEARNLRRHRVVVRLLRPQAHLARRNTVRGVAGSHLASAGDVVGAFESEAPS